MFYKWVAAPVSWVPWLTAGLVRVFMLQDSFGLIEVPADKYWGAQTQRSLANFKIGGPACTMPVEVLRGFGVLKKCAARIHVRSGALDARVGQAVMLAAQELVDGKLDGHFPLVGAGRPGRAVCRGGRGEG